MVSHHFRCHRRACLASGCCSWSQVSPGCCQTAPQGRPRSARASQEVPGTYLKPQPHSRHQSAERAGIETSGQLLLTIYLENEEYSHPGSGQRLNGCSGKLLSGQLPPSPYTETRGARNFLAVLSELSTSSYDDSPNSCRQGCSKQLHAPTWPKTTV